jgi:hypothetical protein
MKNKMLLLVFTSLVAACALSGQIRVKKYTQECTKTENYGKIDTYEVLDMRNKTTFEAAEYIDCGDGRNLVVVTWTGTHDKTTANLAGKIVANFFEHFHGGEDIKYILVPEDSGKNILVYKFVETLAGTI